MRSVLTLAVQVRTARRCPYTTYYRIYCDKEKRFAGFGRQKAMNVPNLKLKAEQAFSMNLHSMVITCSLIGEFDSLNKVKKTGILSFTADI